MKRIVWALLSAVWVMVLAGCSTNPVTGKQELTLISESQELAIGRNQYGPTRQSQGGDYVADPQLTKYVQGVGARLAKVADRKLDYEFQIVNDSTPNAWALPGGKIAINRGLLLQLNDEAELAAVLGHEIVHAAARHSAQQLERGILLQGVVLATAISLGDSKYQQLGVLGANIGAGLTARAYGRDAEREADAYGITYMVRAGYDPHAAIRLQQTFVNLAKDKQPGWLEGMFASHPPSPERVTNNRKRVAALGEPGGEVGRERYRKATARLRRTAPAYKAYDKAVKALEKDNVDEALRLVQKALRIEPSEALFHTLRGQIRERQGRDKDAITNYDRAVVQNPSYFAPQLLRGLLQQKRGNMRLAQVDLTRSADLLPTAEAHYGLGLLAQSGGQDAAAIGHFRKASAASTDAGRKAGVALARLELAQKPDKYISARLFVGRDGWVYVRVRNKASLAVEGVEVAVSQQQGFIRRAIERRSLGRVLAGGASVDLRTRLRAEQVKGLPGLGAQVIAARPQ